MTDQGDSCEDISSGAAVLCLTGASVLLPTMVTLRPRCSAWSIESSEAEDTSAERHD